MSGQERAMLHVGETNSPGRLREVGAQETLRTPCVMGKPASPKLLS